MNIRVRLYGELKTVLGSRELYLTLVEGSPLISVIQILEGKYKAAAPFSTNWDEQLGSVRILINGMDIHTREGLDTELVEGDVITILPMIAGG
jgi:molybdopterin converting factor small subunit